MENININKFAGIFAAWKNCKASNNPDWEEKHEDALNKMLENLPHGSGIDNGVKFDWEKSTYNKLIFSLSFHHMNEVGYYDGWTDHKVIITPSFIGDFCVKITGRNRNDIKDYLREIFSNIFIHHSQVNGL